jgi:hypothetical protein
MTEYWYCLKHGTVETENLCPGAERMGPYPTREQAENALELARQKTEEWDRDPKWRDD